MIINPSLYTGQLVSAFTSVRFPVRDRKNDWSNGSGCHWSTVSYQNAEEKAQLIGQLVHINTVMCKLNNVRHKTMVCIDICKITHFNATSVSIFDPNLCLAFL